MKLLNEDSNTLAVKLQAYLQADLRFAAVYQYTKQRFEDAQDLTAHNWAHTYRDILSAIVIGEAENADMKIVLPAMTMHDIGFLYGANGKNHGAIGADKVAEYLTQAEAHYSEEHIKAISDCIRTHKGSMHDKQPESLEAKVVADADLLDKFGPFGVYQKIRVYTEFNQPLDKILTEANQTSTLTLETATGQKLAEPGRKFVLKFFTELAEAYEPYDSDV